MADPRSITADAFEILVGRELRRAGIEPVQLRRRNVVHIAEEAGYTFDLHGRLEAYGRRWSALIECRNRAGFVGNDDLHALRTRATSASAASALLFTTTDIQPDAIDTARAMSIPLLRVVDAQAALIQSQVIQAGQMPAWLPEFTIEIVTPDGRRLLDPNEPEVVLRELRARE